MKNASNDKARRPIGSMGDKAGFALIEVMIAIVVVGLAIPALMLRMEGINKSVSFMEEKSIAYWIADNKLQEIYINEQLQKGSGIRVRKDAETLEYAGREWHRRVEITDVGKDMPSLSTLIKGQKIYSVEVQVGRSPKDTVAVIEGFVNGK